MDSGSLAVRFPLYHVTCNDSRWTSQRSGNAMSGAWSCVAGCENPRRISLEEEDDDMAILPGLRYRKTITIFPGVKINLSKTGVSTSVGGKGATVNVGTQGRKTINVGIPGTGLSYRAPVGWGIVLILLAIVALVGIAYLVAPAYVKAALHWWQPQWF